MQTMDHLDDSGQITGAVAQPPALVPRQAAVLALKLHALLDGELLPLAQAEPGAPSLYDLVLEYRTAVTDVQEAARIDAALMDAQAWPRSSATLAHLARTLGLSPSQVDALFLWAVQQPA